MIVIALLCGWGTCAEARIDASDLTPLQCQMVATMRAQEVAAQTGKTVARARCADASEADL